MNKNIDDKILLLLKEIEKLQKQKKENTFKKIIDVKEIVNKTNDTKKPRKKVQRKPETNEAKKEIKQRKKYYRNFLSHGGGSYRFLKVQEAFKNKLESYEMKFGDNLKDKILRDYLRFINRKALHNSIAHVLSKKINNITKYNFIVKVSMKRIEINKETNEQIIKFEDAFFNSGTLEYTNEITMISSIDTGRDEIVREIENFVKNGSGWIFNRIDAVHINIASVKPFNGGSYIETPYRIAVTKSCINIQNKDQKCLLWCVIANLHPCEKDAHRVSKYEKYENELNTSGINFPSSDKDIYKFMEQNDMTINVFEWSGGNKKNVLISENLIPCIVCKETRKQHINLLRVRDDNKFHYIMIKNFNKLCFSTTKHEHTKYFCYHCLHGFKNEDVLSEHSKICGSVNGNQLVKLPEKGSELEFNKFGCMIANDFVCYADTEAILENVEDVINEEKESYTRKYQKHIPCGVGYKVVCCYDDQFTFEYKSFRGKDCIKQFLNSLINDTIPRINEIRDIEFHKPLVLTKDEENTFNKNVTCHLCNKKFEDTKEKKVRNHCHITGKYLGSACNGCNLQYKQSLYMPIIFHNFKGYDSHIILKELKSFLDDTSETYEISVIPENMENYMCLSVQKYKIRFIDSLKFMAESIEKLTSYLPKEKFKYTSEMFGENTDIMIKKQVYPYEYFNNFEKFSEPCTFEKSNFDSYLYDTTVGDEDFKHVQKVIKNFNLKTKGDYHDLYLKSDVLLLCDIFENFRKLCLEYYELDPAKFITLPSMAWMAMLKMTRVKLELINDVDIYQFLERMKRGGVSMITHRYAEANNKYMDDYDNKKPSKYIFYGDVNNLYGYSMVQHLPVGKFKWAEIKNNQYYCDLSDESETGYILECDFEYVKELHDLHNEYPLLPENIIINRKMISPYSEKIMLEHDIKCGGKKLTPNLMNKTNYVLHYRNFKQALKMGLKCTKIHRVLQFNQKPFMKKYIDFNTDKRKISKNDFEKNFFKLMNNSVFGKTMENVRKHIDIKLCTSDDKFRKLVNDCRYSSCKVFSDNFVAVERLRKVILLNQPIYVGMSILDISKTLVYDFHYNYFKKNYGEKCKLLMTDTDSLVYEIETEDINEDIFNDRSKKFDMSNYPSESKFYDGENKSKIGLLKNEGEGSEFIKFVGLKSKMYSLINEKRKEKKTGKGINKTVLKRDINFSDYVEVLTEGKQNHNIMKSMRNYKQEVYTIEQKKVSLSAYDDKRYILDDGISSYSYGHWRINL